MIIVLIIIGLKNSKICQLVFTLMLMISVHVVTAQSTQPPFWNDVQEFLQKLNHVSGRNYTLPTEAQWEYAAGGGATSRTKWSGTDVESSLGSYAWFKGNSNRQTHLVGTKSPNGYGLYDMSGNLWEWCSDWYGSYGSGSQTNPQGPSSGSLHVNRGGGWFSNPDRCYVAHRSYDTPDHRDYSLGFRVALIP